MKIVEVISAMMMRLAALPGLSFLQTYVMSARGMRTRFGQRKGDYEAYVAAGQYALKDLRGTEDSPSYGAEAGTDEAGASNIYDDFDYDDNDRSGAYRPLEDYPSGDDHHRYYDDDYRSR